MSDDRDIEYTSGWDSLAKSEREDQDSRPPKRWYGTDKRIGTNRPIP